MKDDIKKWAKAAAVRALKTAAQTAVAMIPVGAAVQEVGWLGVAGVAAGAAVVSLLTSVAGIPEAGDGASVAKIAAGKE
ncbi:hypothetical protein FIC87_11395 [Eggerthella lenta]|uniref:Holin n=1 Tax=Eggerthella lenta TaxID=84112 RepID=A0A5C5BS70_EGGLN|nr:holin [Eggerthella lenta]TNU89392.1 hypothetical protein FIC87_11395 [Eggerthella lenta]